MKQHLNRIFALLTALAMLLALAACGQKDTAPASQEEAPAAETAAETSDAETAEDSASEKHITLTVTYSDETSDIYEIDTTAEYLKDAVDGTVELGGSDGDYGFYIESVNGETADYAADGAYWAIFVNGDYGMYGIDEQPVTDGDAYALVYTVG